MKTVLSLWSISCLHYLTCMEPATEAEEIVFLVFVLSTPTIMTADRTTARAGDDYRSIAKN